MLYTLLHFLFKIFCSIRRILEWNDQKHVHHKCMHVHIGKCAKICMCNSCMCAAGTHAYARKCKCMHVQAHVPAGVCVCGKHFFKLNHIWKGNLPDLSGADRNFEYFNPKKICWLKMSKVIFYFANMTYICSSETPRLPPSTGTPGWRTRLACGWRGWRCL